MKASILYYSLTGQTARTAKAISEGLRWAGCEVSLCELRKAGGRSFAGCDFAGLGTPVHAWGLPLCFDELWDRTQAAAGAPCFVFATYGHNPGNALHHLGKAANRKGMKVFSRFSLLCYDNYAHLVKYAVNKGHPDAADLEAAATYGRSLPGAFEKWRKEGCVEPSLPFSIDELEFSRIVQSRWVNRNVIARKVYDDSKCDKCGACVKVCPVGSIRFEPRLADDERCTGCTGCVLVCKTGAITVPDDRAFKLYFKTVLARHYPLGEWERKAR